MSFNNRTVLITGASRGIGKAIALRLARDGANIIVAAKSITEDPKLGGTIFTAAAEIETAGGRALPVQCDIRDEAQIQHAVAAAAEKFGGIDILVNNASAIVLANAETIETKRLDLMLDINVRGTLLMSRACLPHLKNSSNAHVLTLSPPLNLDLKWFRTHAAYTISKYNMTMIANGLAAEWKKYKIASNTLWPKTTIATAAVNNLLGGEKLMQMSRKPEIMAEAAYSILARNAAECSGNNFIDEDIVVADGETNLDKYAVTPGGQLWPDLFL